MAILRAIGLFLGLLLVGTLGVPAYFPHVPALFSEGFPAPVWPATGDFETVAGQAVAPLPEARASDDVTLALFENSGGQAMLAERGGTLRSAVFAEGFDARTQFNSYSMVKSLVGLLVIKAVAEGRLPGLDARLPDVLGPEMPYLTLRSLLDMSGGLAATSEPVKSDGDEGYSPFSPLGKVHAYGPEAALGDLWIDTARQGEFHYQSVNTALLGRVVEQAYGQTLATVLSEKIWQPAGAAPALWRAHPLGTGVSAYRCLYATAVDWLRVGRFLLDNGPSEAPFLPRSLLQDAFQPDLDPDIRRAGAYRMHIRHDILDRPSVPVSGPFAYFMGHGGQVLYLHPDADAVVVRFGARPQLLHSTLYATLGDGAGR